jgi:hypothetical protein
MLACVTKIKRAGDEANSPSLGLHLSVLWTEDMDKVMANNEAPKPTNPFALLSLQFKKLLDLTHMTIKCVERLVHLIFYSEITVKVSHAHVLFNSGSVLIASLCVCHES